MTRVVEPYEHGIWLVAYLGLVGFLAQTLLRRGQDELSSDPNRFGRAEAALWNIGVIAVPAGVLLDVRAAVAAGSFALIAALVLFWLSVRPDDGERPPKRTRRSYSALLAFMLVSVIVGMALSADVPWTG